MKPDLLAAVADLSDADLVARVQTLAARERAATTALIAHLAELDRRRRSTPPTGASRRPAPRGGSP